jgi:hypothetical protein
MANKKKISSSKPPALGGKKPYTKPSVASESIYEVTALACGKTPGNPADMNCTANTGRPHNS